MVFGLGKLFGGSNEPQEAPPEAAVKAAPAAPAVEQAPTTFVRRDAVFSRERRIAGHLYHLQLLDSRLGDAETPRQVQHDDLLLRSLCLSKDDDSWGNLYGFIPISSASLDNPWLERLPSENTVLLISLAPETVNGEELVQRVETLKARGLRIGVFRQPKHPAFGALVMAADFAAVNVADNPGGNIRDFSVALRSAKDVRHLIELFGANIETLDDQVLCHRCHFAFFHGPFVKLEDRWEQPKGDPHKLHLMHLLNLAQGDAEIPELSAALKQDPVLTYRILRYLNSPAIGLAREITSIDHALIVLGRLRLARWLSVLLFSVREPDFADWLLVESSLTRGRIMEILGKERFPVAESDHLFITGVFSTLDKLLRIPLAEAVEKVRLPTNIKTALLERAGPYAPLLAVAEACEAFDPQRMAETSRAANLDPKAVNQALLSATSWASDVTAHWE
ncbi:MAG: putative signal transduction protein containing and modified domain [Proteobacteria bacterium]|nr:putative signal transduction protein containing and modified domain [Pseudomonadota bacterium]